jgi:hypothetical protein
MSDPAQWLDSIGYCCRCGKQAHGILRGVSGESLGVFCDTCAADRIQKARSERDKEELS